jgi:hypothetical protein
MHCSPNYSRGIPLGSPRPVPEAPARSATRSTARYCAIAQPSVKQIDGTTAPGWRLVRSQKAPVFAPSSPCLAGHMAATQAGSSGVAAAPTRADTLPDHDAGRARFARASLRLVPPLRSRGSASPRGVPPILRRSQAARPSSEGPSLRPLRRCAAMPSQVQVVLQNPARRYDGEVVTVEFGAGARQLEPLGEQAATGMRRRSARKCLAGE